MLGGLLASLLNSLRYRFGRARTEAAESGEYRPTRREELAALDQQSHGESRVVAQTMADDNALRATGKGRRL